MNKTHETRLKEIISNLSRALNYKTLPKYCRQEINHSKNQTEIILRELQFPITNDKDFGYKNCIRDMPTCELEFLSKKDYDSWIKWKELYVNILYKEENEKRC